MKREAMIIVGLTAVLGLAACGKKEESAPAPNAEQGAQGPAGMQGALPPNHPPTQGAPGGMPGGMPPGMGGAPGMQAAPQGPREVVVPDEVKKAWKAVVIQLTDKKANKTEDVTVEIGKTVKVNGLEITVENFIPSFTMGGGNITSKSNNTENPAARVVVKENGNQIFAGWLFSLYPQAHPMQHEKYSIVLKDFKKK